MIIGVGIDAVDIERFADWHQHDVTTLKNFFSDDEIAYCLQETTVSAERFAARFAAKEAAYKALMPIIVPGLHLRTFVSLCSIKRGQYGQPLLEIAWDKVIAPEHIHVAKPIAHLSITHTASTATAIVILENTYN